MRSSGGGTRSCSRSDAVRLADTIGRRVGAIVVRLLVGIGEGLVLALDNAHELEGRVGTSDGVGENIADGQVDGLLVEIVREDDEASVELRSLVENVLECGNDTGCADGSSSNVPVVRVKVVVVVSGPDDSGEAHSLANSTHTVIDISIRRSESIGSDTVEMISTRSVIAHKYAPSDVLDDLGSPSELGNNLLVGKSSKRGVRPCYKRVSRSHNRRRFDVLWTDNWCPCIYSAWRMSWRERARDPTTKKVECRFWEAR
jgi:hypothetical protein